VTEWIIVKGICDWGYKKDNPNKETDQKMAASAADEPSGTPAMRSRSRGGVTSTWPLTLPLSLSAGNVSACGVFFVLLVKLSKERKSASLSSAWRGFFLAHKGGGKIRL
jgi:hypothetical protein